MSTLPITDEALAAIARRADVSDSVDYVVDDETMADLRRLLEEVNRLRAKVQQILGEQYDLLSDRDRLRDALAESEARREDLARRLDQHRDDLVNVNAEIARVVSENNVQADKLGKAERLAEGWMRAGNRSISSSALAAEHFDALNECGASLARVLDQSEEPTDV